MVEDRFVGIKSRGVYETPGGTILRNAHMDIETITQDREVARLAAQFSFKFAELVYNGFWYSPEFDLLLTLVKKSQEGVTGSVQLSLYRGTAFPVARSSPISRYDKDLVSFDKEGGFNPLDSEGFIRINAIRLKVNNVLQKRKAAQI